MPKHTEENNSPSDSSLRRIEDIVCNLPNNPPPSTTIGDFLDLFYNWDPSGAENLSPLPFHYD